MGFLLDNSTEIGLVFFFTVFVGVAIWAFLPSQKEKIESYKNIPLTEDENVK